MLCTDPPVATPKGSSEGGWDSIHVFEAIDRARTAHYKLTSTVILHLRTGNDTLGEMDLSGNMTRQVEQDMPVQGDGSHVVNVGKLVEDMELKMRNLLRMFKLYLLIYSYIPCVLFQTDVRPEEVYFGKAKDIVGDLRSTLIPWFLEARGLMSISGIQPLTEANRDKSTHQEMINSMKR